MMKTIQLPYGKETRTLRIEEKHLAGVLTSGMASFKAEKSPEELIRDALMHPVGTRPLRELAAGKNSVVVISSDHTRPVPSRLIMPQILHEIRCGNPDAEITILVATGLHRATTSEELRDRYGDEIVGKERIVVHDCDDREHLVCVGTLPSGGKLELNSIAVNADLLVAEGFIEPHFFAGYSGGRKSVLPGIASRASVMYNHNAGFINDPHARTGVLEGNPVHADMRYAAEAVGLDFIVNVVLDAAHNPVFCVAGHYACAHKAGTDFLKSKCRVAPIFSDIVIATNGGYPLDQNIYQAVKGMTAAEASVKEGGVIIMAAQCADGHGGKSFYETFRQEKDLHRMMDTFLSRKPEETIIDQWQSQILARVLMKAPVIFVSDCDDEMVRDLHLIPAHSMDEALEKAVKMCGRKDYSVTVIPDGVSVIVGEDE